jgi:hypothetical protein
MGKVGIMLMQASLEQPHTAAEHPASRPLYQRVSWVLLLVLGAFFLVAPLLDLVADARAGLPADHLGAFQSLAGTGWSVARQSEPGTTRYVTLLEDDYAVHELVFGILFIVLVAIPLRRGERWAWWSCWAVMLAALTYSLTFGAHDRTILARSLSPLSGCRSSCSSRRRRSSAWAARGTTTGTEVAGTTRRAMPGQ